MHDPASRPIVDKIVKPRRPGNADLPIIVLADDHIFVERLGQFYPASELPRVIGTEPSSIIVCHNAIITLAHLDPIFDHVLSWQYRVSPIEREVWKPNRERKVTYTDTVVAFFGFTGNNEKGKRRTPNRYFYPLDPKVFVRKTIYELRGKSAPEDGGDGRMEMEKLYDWSREVREFCIANKLRVSPTSGGLAAQLLRDKRFYPEARRKVPKATNAVARTALPGNFYRLYETSEGVINDATYLDQKNAHHEAAKSLSFPLSDSLFARGFYLDYAKGNHRPWLRKGSRAFERFFEQHSGLVLCRINVNQMPPVSFHLPCMDKTGEHEALLFTNEIEYLHSFRGCYVDCVYAAWTSPERDAGLNAYAGWAIEQIEESNPYRRNWLKPVLLASYGILAAKPRHMEFGYKRAKSGDAKRYPAGPYPLNVIAKRASKESEPTIANVIHRGMVEAETRLRSLKLARELHSQRIRILAVYADSIFVDAKGQLPFLPHPWKIQQHLTALRFHNSTSFTSRELEKLPGVPKQKRIEMSQARSVHSVSKKSARNRATGERWLQSLPIRPR